MYNRYCKIGKKTVQKGLERGRERKEGKEKLEKKGKIKTELH